MFFEYDMAIFQLFFLSVYYMLITTKPISSLLKNYIPFFLISHAIGNSK
jgi:hypothetical protein